MRRLFDDVLHTREPGTKLFFFESRMYMSYWYASLYIVIEGWQQLGASDPEIDGLLKSKNVNLLRRYRNGTFHYQKRYNDKRFLDLIRNGHDTIHWVRELTDAYQRYFLVGLKDYFSPDGDVREGE